MRFIALPAGALPILTLLILALLVPAGCDSPSPSMRGATRTVVEIEGSRFSVHRIDDRVEVYRTSFEYHPMMDITRMRAEMAIQQATGCAVRANSFDGDPALMKARLDCGQNLPPLPEVDNIAYDCEVMADWVSEGRNTRTTSILCTPI